ncbi:hypothetical protein AB4Z38_13905 [Arthrobacter sp. 2RAF6]|uniref:hypothetical protein n=1 Tax=Arthrobacter sp. 2RAF6 TaxID=3233002 RepID=UPI003F902D01
MNNLIFWIIVCSWLIPMGIRMYNRSRQRRLRNGDYGNNSYGNYPGTPPGQFPGQQYPDGPFSGQSYPPQNYPPQNYPVGYPEQPPVIIPAEPQPPVATPARQAARPSSATPQANAAPQGYRARKLAELDQEYSDGKIAMEDYMKLRQEIMNG